MSGLKNSGKKAVDAILNPQKIDVAFQKFTRPTVGAGKPTFPTSQRDLKNIGFHFDLADHSRQVPDARPNAKPGATRTANVFHWQAAAQAESKSIKDWIQKNGSHAVIQTLEFPVDATKEEFIGVSIICKSTIGNRGMARFLQPMMVRHVLNGWVHMRLGRSTQTSAMSC